MVSTSGNGIEIAVAASVDDDLVAAFSRLIPQLSRSAAVPPRDVSREIVEAQASPVLIAGTSETMGASWASVWPRSRRPALRRFAGNYLSENRFRTAWAAWRPA